MKKIVSAATLCLLALLSVNAASEPPPKVKSIVAAATSSGLLSAQDFSTKTLSPDELLEFEKVIQKLDWIAEIPGLESVLKSNFPFESGVHKKSGFTLTIHYSGAQIMLLSCSVPLVNGSEQEQRQMIETMLATTEELIGHDSGVRQWLDTEWQRSWDISAKQFAKQPVDPKEIFRKREFGPFLVTVWGVVPDIVFMNCVRKANQAMDSTARTP